MLHVPYDVSDDAQSGSEYSKQISSRKNIDGYRKFVATHGQLQNYVDLNYTARSLLSATRLKYQQTVSFP